MHFYLPGMLHEGLSLASVWQWRVRPRFSPREAYQWPSGPGATKDLIEVIALKVLMNFPRTVVACDSQLFQKRRIMFRARAESCELRAVELRKAIMNCELEVFEEQDIVAARLLLLFQ